MKGVVDSGVDITIMGGQMFKQVAQVSTTGDDSEMDTSQLLEALPMELKLSDFQEEQRKDPNLLGLIRYLKDGQLPEDNLRSRNIAAQAPQFALVEVFSTFLKPRGALRRKRLCQPVSRRQFCVIHIPQGWQNTFLVHHCKLTLVVVDAIS